MLKRKDIKNRNLVFDWSRDTYHIIENVGNAREKGDRGESTTPDNELSYSIVDIVSKEVHGGICEHSGMTDDLSITSKKDIEIYLANLEADASIELGKAKKQYVVIQDAINRFNEI